MVHESENGEGEDGAGLTGISAEQTMRSGAVAAEQGGKGISGDGELGRGRCGGLGPHEHTGLS